MYKVCTNKDDGIPFHSDIEDDVTSLAEFTPETLVQSAAKCLILINPDVVVPMAMPSGMAQRFSATTTLADACVVRMSLPTQKLVFIYLWSIIYILFDSLSDFEATSATKPSCTRM